MRLTRVYLEGPLTPHSVVNLPAATAAHVAKVLRARSGDPLILFNGDGREFSGTVESVRGARVSAAVGDGRVCERESPLSVTLIQCLLRAERMDFVVQKATELGVARIVPVLSQRSVVRLDKAQAQSKSGHWRAVAVGACEQCGRNRVPEIAPAQPLLNHLGDLRRGTGPLWVFEPASEPRAGGAPPPVHRAFAPPSGAITEAHIAIGPEGGFTDDELEAFRVAGFSQVGLGPRILRAETAALAALAWMQAKFGDM